ncbi:MAG TPA: helix-turn-helix domain-containing protein [Pseudoneobacillus sp.]|nr:helix-turn-helix domain-containing protein [Pseudoneobacillus sp.]
MNQLIHEEEINESVMKERANILGVNLELPRVLIFLECIGDIENINFSKLMRSVHYELDKADLIALTYNNNIVILKYVKKEENDLHHFLSRIAKPIKEHANDFFLISSGSFAPTIKELKTSFINAQKTIKVGRILFPFQNVYHFNQLQLEVLLSQLGQVKMFTFYNEIKEHDKNGELQQTLQAFINENGELNKVAESLFIHRNTLRYRLDKITELTGKDPRKIKDLIELYTAKILHELK